MFGITEVDMALTRAPSQFLWERDLFKWADANRAISLKSIDELAIILEGLTSRRIDAMEDPAELTIGTVDSLTVKVCGFFR